MNLLLYIVRDDCVITWFPARVLGLVREPHFLVRCWRTLFPRSVVARGARDVRVCRIMPRNRFIRLEHIRMTFCIRATRCGRMRIVAIGATQVLVRHRAHIDLVIIAMAFFAQLGVRFHQLVRITGWVELSNCRIEPCHLFGHGLFFGLVALLATNVFPICFFNWLGCFDGEFACCACCRHVFGRCGNPVHRRMTSNAVIRHLWNKRVCMFTCGIHLLHSQLCGYQCNSWLGYCGC